MQIGSGAGYTRRNRYRHRGGKVSAALDLEAYSLAAKPLAFANPDRYFSDLDLRLNVVCPFDGFTPEAKAEQMSRIGGYDGQPRTVEPLCGEVMQDVPGTAQGNWFAGGFAGPVDCPNELSLVHDYIDPTKSAISVGRTIMESGHGFSMRRTPERSTATSIK